MLLQGRSRKRQGKSRRPPRGAAAPGVSDSGEPNMPLSTIAPALCSVQGSRYRESCRRRRGRPQQATQPQRSTRPLGLFSWTEGGAMQEIETRAYLANGTQPEPEEAVAWAFEQKTAAGRPQVLRPARKLAAHDAAGQRVRRRRRSRGTRLRRLVDPRLAGDRRERPAADAGPGERRPRPLHGGAHALARLRDRRPDDGRALRARPAPHRPARGGAISSETGIADTANFGPECEFFVFDEVSYELSPHRVALRGRLGRRPLELGDARARLHRAREGRLLPAGARTTRCTTCAPRSCSRWSGSGSRASSTTTRWPRRVSARSTSATSRSRAWPTRS